MPRPISVLVVDDHPALRAGLSGLLEQEPGLEFLGAVSSEADMLKAINARRPDVVILDYALGRGDGLTACFRVKQGVHAPAVILYSAYVDSVFGVPAAVAQADQIVSKSAPVDELLGAIHAASVGEHEFLRPDPEFLEAATARLDAEDLPVLGMLFARVPVRDIAATLDMSPAEVRNRALRIIGEMQSTDRRDLIAAT